MSTIHSNLLEFNYGQNKGVRKLPEINKSILGSKKRQFPYMLNEGHAVVTLATKQVALVCRYLTVKWLPRLSGAQSPSRLISSVVLDLFLGTEV